MDNRKGSIGDLLSGIDNDNNKIRKVFLNGLVGIVDDDGNVEMERNLKIKNIINRINKNG